MVAVLEYLTTMLDLSKLLTALLEYLDLFYGIMLSTNFLAAKILVSPQNASIIPVSYTYLLCWYNCRMPTGV